MAVDDWHPGQLVVVWVGGLLAEFLLVGFASALIDSGKDFLDDAALLLFLLAVALPFVLLWITWQWFGARQKRKR